MRRRKIVTMNGSGVFAVLLELLCLALQSSVSQAQNTTASYLTLPLNKTVAVGKSAVFQCGVSLSTSEIVFTIYTSNRNYSLNCPGPEVLPVKKLKGSCRKTSDQLIADWSFRGTSSSDNNTRIECTQSGQSPVEAYLRVYEDATKFATIIGCSIGGFFGILLVFGLFYVMMKKFPKLQQCLGGSDPVDDVTLVSKD